MLHLWEFAVISYLRTNSAEMPGIAVNREPRNKGDEVAESESLRGGSHRNWQQLAHLVNNSSPLSSFPAGKVLFASLFGP